MIASLAADNKIMQNLKHYIIDGNNLIGKDSTLSKAQRTEKQNARKGVVLLLENFLLNNKVKISLHFDGHPDDSVKSHKIKINYSYSKEADYFIKKEIDIVKNTNNVIVVSSDSSIAQYARVSKCEAKPAEVFLREIKTIDSADEEEKKINESGSVAEFKILFGVK